MSVIPASVKPRWVKPRLVATDVRTAAGRPPATRWKSRNLPGRKQTQVRFERALRYSTRGVTVLLVGRHSPIIMPEVDRHLLKCAPSFVEVEDGFSAAGRQFVQRLSARGNRRGNGSDALPVISRHRARTSRADGEIQSRARVDG